MEPQTLTWLATLVGGLGIGSILTTLMNYIFAGRSATKERLYREKRETYLGLLDALHRAAVEPSDASSKQFALWQTRVQLFGDDHGHVAQAAQGIIDTNGGPNDKRISFFEQLINSMRRDLRRSA